MSSGEWRELAIVYASETIGEIGGGTNFLPEHLQEELAVATVLAGTLQTIFELKLPSPAQFAIRSIHGLLPVVCRLLNDRKSVGCYSKRPSFNALIVLGACSEGNTKYPDTLEFGKALQASLLCLNSTSERVPILSGILLFPSENKNHTKREQVYDSGFRLGKDLVLSALEALDPRFGYEESLG